MWLNAVRAIADCGYEYEENKGIFLLWGTRKDLLFIGNFHCFPPFSPVFPGKVNHFAANLRHFPYTLCLFFLRFHREVAKFCGNFNSGAWRFFEYTDNQLVSENGRTFRALKTFEMCTCVFKCIDIQSVAKLPAPGLPLRSFIRIRNAHVCSFRESEPNYRESEALSRRKC